MYENDILELWLWNQINTITAIYSKAFLFVIVVTVIIF